MGWMGCLSCMLLVLSCISEIIQGTSSGNNPTKTVVVRVFEKAPRGTLIYQVEGNSFLDVTKHRLFQLVQTGPDQDKFGLTNQNTLRVDEYPYLSGALDQVYIIYIQARTVDSRKALISKLEIQVIVSKTNTFPPNFDEAPRFEVFQDIQEGTIIGQVQVSDADEEAYNRQSVFKLIPSHSTPFSISEQTGVLRTTDRLEDTPQTFSLKVTAINTGSPQLKKSSTLTVVVRKISEPLSFSIERHNLSHVEACWQEPSYGTVKRYQLRLEKQQHLGSVTRRLVKPEPRQKQCLEFALEPQQAYVITARAMNGAKLGLPSRVKFNMERSRCGQEVCTGRCLFTPDGATCLCEGKKRNCGYSGRCSDCAISDQTLCQCAKGDENCESECSQTCLNNGDTQFDAAGNLYCHCAGGYYGNRCEKYDSCTEVSCENGGSCKNISSSEYECVCDNGFYGEHCGNFNPCFKRPCRNSGRCLNISSSEYRCTCMHGFYGDHCQRYDPCFVRPCLNNGLCKNTSDTSYTCTCAPGYYGHSCEVYQPCSSNPCLHGGFCNSVDGQYECHCPRGRFGRKCEHVNLCIQLEPCGDHKVTCHNMTDFGYKCICEPGWHGENCTDFDPCFDQPCQHGGVCKQSSDFSYTCTCPGTHYGENCERTNLCASHPCKNGATCRNISNHDYQCVCTEGYYGDTCEEYDTCHNSHCQNGGICQNSSQTGYTCICPDTYLGDLCQHYNSCYESPCEHGQCRVDADGFYSCECELGYHGINCQTYNPCLSSPCHNRGACVQTSDGKYGCLCEVDYYGDLCEHYDSCHSNPCQLGECMNLPDKRYKCDCPSGKYGLQCDSNDPCSGNPCQNGAMCIHVQYHEYNCKCAQGWYGIHCELRSPCTSNPCQHGGQCLHLNDDTFLCTCGENFQGRFCEEEIPCKPDQGRSCLNDGKCVQRHDGSFNCECPEGYHGYRCQGYDPCRLDGLCQNGGTCISMENNEFLCQCLDGFFGEHCEYYTFCREEGYCSRGATCVRGMQMTCYCPPGFTGPRCTEDIDECLTSPCHKDATCRNLEGSFLCECDYGHTGPDCQITVSCGTETTHDARGTFTWTGTRHGFSVGIECAEPRGKYANRHCLLQEDGTARWSEPDTSECELNIKNASQALQTLMRYRNVTSFDSSYELVQVKELLNAVLKYSLDDNSVTDEFMSIIDKILSAPSDVIRASQVANSEERRLEPGEKCQHCGILELLDEFLSYVPILNKMTIRKTNFELFTKKNTYIEHDHGITFTPENNPKAKIFLPSIVFERDQSNERVKFIHFRSSKLFSVESGKPTVGHITTGSWKGRGNQYIQLVKVLHCKLPTNGHVNEVLSASVGHTETMNLQEGVKFSLPNMESPRHAKCVYWDEKGKFWATDGLLTLTHSGFTTQCSSSHLSYFSVASNPEAAHITMTQEHLYLMLTSYIGSVVGVLALATVFTTYTIFSPLNRSSTGQVLIQLSLSLILLAVSLLLARDRQQLSSDAFCLSVAIFTHFLFLSSFLWVLVLGQTVYVNSTDGEVVATSMYVIKRCIFAYGLPLVCVLTASLLNSTLYLYDLDTCHVVPQPRALYYCFYLTPCGMAILGEVVIALRLVKSKCCTSKSHNSTTEGTDKGGSTFWQTYGSISTMFLLTLSWVLKLTAAVTKKLDYTVYFGSAHFITTGFVGCCVCFFFFIMSPSARLSWTQCNQRNTLSSHQRVAGKGNNIQSQTRSTENKYTLVGTKPKDTSKDKTRFHRQKTVHRSTTSDFTVPDSPPSGTLCSQASQNSSQIALSARNSTLTDLNKRDSPYIAHNTKESPDITHNARDFPHIIQNTRNSPHVSHNAGECPYTAQNASDSQYVTLTAKDSSHTTKNAKNSPHIPLSLKNSPNVCQTSRNFTHRTGISRESPHMSHLSRISPHLGQTERSITHKPQTSKASPQAGASARYSPQLTHFDVDQMDFTARTSRV